jgi:tetratricopeptide (TPR) repeat protein
MGSGHDHGPRRPWGEPAPSPLRRLMSRASALVGTPAPRPRRGPRELPQALRRSEHAAAYLAAEGEHDDADAGAAALEALERSASAGEWWPADVWGHRALWHFEQAGMALESVRAARRIGDVRRAAGDPDSARRYYAEAIDEARDIGAEHEQGLASLGLGHALLERGEVTTGRRMASAAVTLLERAGATAAEIQGARQLLGTEVPVGESTEER